jgi:transcriptional regulator with XRE-family HTH domain
VAHIARKFEHLLRAHRRPDGREWSGAELEKATGGLVTRSYVTNLRKGRIENPGYEKMRAIAKAMGFAPGLWFEEMSASGARTVPETSLEGSSDSSERSGTRRPGSPTPAPRSPEWARTCSRRMRSRA